MRIQETNQILKEAEIRRHDHQQHSDEQPSGGLMRRLRSAVPRIRSAMRHASVPWIISGASVLLAATGLIAARKNRKRSLFGW